MSKKKITAPLSYDPGKGRPKEYLAYLNWQEMQALQRLNGGNMELGPRGLPSFPPDDSIGSNQTPGSGNWTGSPGGTSVGSGPGGDVGGTTESGNIGGAGTSTSTTSSDASSAASTTSAASQNTTDEAAQQAAAVNNAAAAARNAALSEDARRAGIGSIEVGPMRTPVNIGGGAISAAVQTGIQQSYAGVSPTMPGGGGMGQLNARRGSLTTAVGPTTGVDAFGNIATGSVFGTSPSIASRYDSLEADIDRRNLTRVAEAAQTGMPVSLSAPSGVYGPRATPSIPSYMKTMSMPGMITTGMPSDYSGTIRQKNTTVAYKTPDPNVTTAYKTPDTSVTDYVPTQFETEVSYTPYRPTIASGTYTTPYNAPSPITADEQRKIDVQYQNMGIDDYANVIAGPTSAEKLKSVFASYGIGETPAENEIANVEEQYRTQPSGIASLPGVSPMQDEAVYPEKTAVQKYIAENIPYAKYAVKIADFLGRREFEGLTPDEKNALAARWVSEQEAFKRGNIPENRPDREVPPYIQPPYRPAVRQSPRNSSQYDLWDKGIGIPEPGDPDYNDYMKYLESRGTSAQV